MTTETSADSITTDTSAWVICPPFTARQCPTCDTWVLGKDDWAHFNREHYAAWAAEQTALHGNVIGFPFFRWNDKAVRVER